MDVKLQTETKSKVKDHKSDDTDFLSVTCYALKCHGQL